MHIQTQTADALRADCHGILCTDPVFFPPGQILRCGDAQHRLAVVLGFPAVKRHCRHADSTDFLSPHGFDHHLVSRIGFHE